MGEIGRKILQGMGFVEYRLVKRSRLPEEEGR